MCVCYNRACIYTEREWEGTNKSTRLILVSQWLGDGYICFILFTLCLTFCGCWDRVSLWQPGRLTWNSWQSSCLSVLSVYMRVPPHRANTASGTWKKTLSPALSSPALPTPAAGPGERSLSAEVPLASPAWYYFNCKLNPNWWVLKPVNSMSTPVYVFRGTCVHT